MNKFYLITIVLALAFVSIEARPRFFECFELIFRRGQHQNTSSTGHESSFSYDSSSANGPANWPGVCQNGTRQSPITYDQVKATSVQDANRLRMIGAFNTRPTEIYFLNNGHGIAMSFKYPTADVPQITGGPLNNEIYKFHSFHYHTPCEHKAIAHNSKCKLEVHYVHFNAKYPNISEAIDKPDGLAVIGIMYEPRILQLIPTLKFLPMIMKVFQYDTEYTEVNNVFSYAEAMGFTSIPKVISYKGSLTTPKCAESVTWLVVDKLYTISPVALEILYNVRDSLGDRLYMNNRPVQPLNGRTLTAHNEF